MASPGPAIFGYLPRSNAAVGYLAHAPRGVDPMADRVLGRGVFVSHAEARRARLSRNTLAGTFSAGIPTRRSASDAPPPVSALPPAAGPDEAVAMPAAAPAATVPAVASPMASVPSSPMRGPAPPPLPATLQRVERIGRGLMLEPAIGSPPWAAAAVQVADAAATLPPLLMLAASPALLPVPPPQSAPSPLLSPQPQPVQGSAAVVTLGSGSGTADSPLHHSVLPSPQQLRHLHAGIQRSPSLPMFHDGAGAQKPPAHGTPPVQAVVRIGRSSFSAREPAASAAGAGGSVSGDDSVFFTADLAAGQSADALASNGSTPSPSPSPQLSCWPSPSLSAVSLAPATASLPPLPLLLSASAGAKSSDIALDYELGARLGSGAYAEVRAARRRPRPPSGAGESLGGTGAGPSVAIAAADAVAVKLIRKRFLVREDEREGVRREVEVHRFVSGLLRESRDALRAATGAIGIGTNGNGSSIGGGNGGGVAGGAGGERLLPVGGSAVHERVIELLDVYEDARFVYLVLEAAPSGSLVDYIRAKSVRRFSATQARVIMGQLLEALEFLHNKGVLHGDVKPANILVAESALIAGGSQGGAGTSTSGAALQHFIGAIQLCDFGNARRSRDARYFKLTGDVRLCPPAVSGTLGYVAPEVLARRSFGDACDVWSAGVLLYELLAGVAPFAPPFTVPAAGTPTPPELFCHPPWTGGELSVSASALCAAMLVTDPAARPSARDARAAAWFEGK